MVESAGLLVVIHALAILDVVEPTALKVISILVGQVRDVVPGALSGVASTTNEVETDLSYRY